MPVIAASIFEQLREFSFRGIAFPAQTTRLSFRHSHVQHKWADRDGAHVEATGRDPIEIDVSIPMRNFIAPGPMEKWTGPLYPTVFRALLTALLDRTTGLLRHPELGGLKCKPVSCDVRWDPNKRDGVDIDARFVESTDNATTIDTAIASKSPIANAVQTGADLDNQIASIPSLPQTPPGTLSFADSMRSLQAITDQASLVSAKVQGTVNGVIYRLNVMENSAIAAKNAKYWPVITSCEALKSTLRDLQKSMLVATRSILFYVTPAVITLGQVSITTGAKIADLIALNPTLAASAAIPAQTLVRYYG